MAQEVKTRLCMTHLAKPRRTFFTIDALEGILSELRRKGHVFQVMYPRNAPLGHDLRTCSSTPVLEFTGLHEAAHDRHVIKWLVDVKRTLQGECADLIFHAALAMSGSNHVLHVALSPQAKPLLETVIDLHLADLQKLMPDVTCMPLFSAPAAAPLLEDAAK